VLSLLLALQRPPKELQQQEAQAASFSPQSVVRSRVYDLLAAEGELRNECCQSSNRREFQTEMMIHNGSLGAKPDMLTFPTAWVCFDCGYSTFTLAQNELLELRGACMNNGVH
jgi:hypothetical protein